MRHTGLESIGTMNTARAVLRLLQGLLTLLLAISSVRADEIVTLETRAGVTQSFLLWTLPTAKPGTVILMLPGGPGNIGLQKSDGRVEASRPYFFSSWRNALAAEKFAVAVVDAPSDQKDMTQAFRTSEAHMTDMQAVVSELRRRFSGAKLVVMGHSRGTISAGTLVQRSREHVSALALLAGLYQETVPSPNAPSSGPGLSKVDLPALNLPTLLVHHISDACPVAPMDAAVKQGKRLPLVSVSGGNDAAGDSPCGPGTPHWFSGKEQAVWQSVRTWLVREIR